MLKMCFFFGGDVDYFGFFTGYFMVVVFFAIVIFVISLNACYLTRTIVTGEGREACECERERGSRKIKEGERERGICLLYLI